MASRRGDDRCGRRRVWAPRCAIPVREWAERLASWHSGNRDDWRTVAIKSKKWLPTELAVALGVEIRPVGVTRDRPAVQRRRRVRWRGGSYHVVGRRVEHCNPCGDGLGVFEVSGAALDHLGGEDVHQPVCPDGGGKWPVPVAVVDGVVREDKRFRVLGRAAVANIETFPVLQHGHVVHHVHDAGRHAHEGILKHPKHAAVRQGCCPLVVGTDDVARGSIEQGVEHVGRRAGEAYRPL